MGLDWTDKVDGQDYIVAEDVNSLAAAILENEGAISGLTPKADHGESAYNKLQSGIGTDDIVDGAVTTGKIAKNAITGVKLSLAVYTAMQQGQDAYELLQSGIGTDNIANAAVAKAKLAADVLEAIYGAYPTEGATAITRFRTLLGADNIPTKTALVKQTAGSVPMDWTLRRCGKNQFDAVTVTFKKGYNINSSGAEATNSAYAYTLQLIPVIPGARYVASGFRDRATDVSLLANTFCTMCFYDAQGVFKTRHAPYGDSQNPVFTTPSIANGDDYDCCFVRFYCSVGLIGDDNKIAKRAYIGNVWYDVAIQFEIVDDPSATAAAATAYEPYSGVDYAVPITALDTPTAPTETPITALGVNVFSLFPTNLPAVGSSFSATATMDIAARLDPTLVYEQLKTAIVAANA